MTLPSRNAMATPCLAYCTCAFVFTAALFRTVPAIAQETFTITDLGTLGGSSSFAYGVNDQGDAVRDSSPWRLQFTRVSLA